MLPTLHIQLLDGFRLSINDIPIPILDHPRLQALLAYLILHRHAPQSRQYLAFLLWPDSTETQARTNLRGLLHRLRQALPDTTRFLTLDAQTVQWRSDASCSVDVADFERDLALATQAEHNRDVETVQSVLTQAVEQYRGELLPGWYDDWVLVERERLRQAFLAALERLILVLEGRRQYAAAIGYAQRLLRHDPLHEVTYQHLLRLHALSGDRASALRIYQTCITVLERELGVEPSSATRDAYESALHTETPAIAPGELRMPAAAIAPHNNLPIALTSFVGREQELIEVRQLLDRTRLLTLIGAGGSGKTRLALAVARMGITVYADGVVLVELAALTEAALVPHAVATALGVREEPQRRLTTTLVDALRPKVLLLVLDNCEHLIDTCAHLAAELLGACPQLRILATSREVLGVAGETTWLVPPLTVPNLHQLVGSEALSQVEAVRLFVDRAAAVLPTFRLTQANAAVVAQICRQLDGLPLAIELAAARVKILAVEQIAARLADCFRVLAGGSRTALPRQQTMWAAIDWSYVLLSASERALFRRLAIFVGGWSLEAAEVVCVGEGVAADDVVELLAHLVDKSLVMVAPHAGRHARYRLLEPIRQYAYEKLQQSEEVAVIQEQHARFFLALAERASPQLRGAQQSLWFDRLEVEQDNLQATLVRGRTAASAEINLRLAGALWWFWFIRGRLSEARRWLEDALAQGGATPMLLRTRALSWAGFLAWFGDEDTHAIALLEESLALSRELDDSLSMTWSLTTLGSITYRQGDPVQATLFLRESLALSQELGDTWSVAWSLATLSSIAHGQADYVQATRLMEDSLRLSREMGDKWSIAWSLGGLGHIALDQGNVAQAVLHFEESLAVRSELGDRRGKAYSLDDLGRAALAQGEYTRAATLIGESVTLLQELGHSIDLMYRLEGLAEVAVGQGQAQLAARICAAIERSAEAAGVSLEPLYREKYNRCVATIHQQLNATTFASAWAHGRALTVEQAIAEAVSLTTRQTKDAPCR